MFEISIVIKGTLWCIQYGGVACRCVGCRNCWADDQRLTLCYTFSRVNRFTTTEANGTGAAFVLRNRLQARNFLTGAFSSKTAFNKSNIELLCGCIQLRLYAQNIIRMCNQQRRIPEGLYKVTQVQQLIFALHIFGWTDKCFSHIDIRLLI
ncbi:hypothetical protein D1872_256250 [compost metagenome]